MASLPLLFHFLFAVVTIDVPVFGDTELKLGLTFQPNRPYNVVAERRAPFLLNCSAVRDPDPEFGPLNFTWFKDGDAIVETGRVKVLQNGSLFIKKIVHKRHKHSRSTTSTHKRQIRTDSGLYECYVENKIGILLGRRVHLDVAEIGRKFNIQPLNQTSRVGSVTRFQCHIDGVPSPNYIWEKNGVQIRPNHQPWMRFTMFPSGILQILDIRSSDAGNYRCMTLPGIVKDIKHSAYAHLTVLESSGHRAPKIIAGPANQTVASNSEVVLECLADGEPRPVITWTRIQNSRNGNQETLVDFGEQSLGGNLRIREVLPQHEGIYICNASSYAYKDNPDKKFAALIVEVPPVFHIAPRNEKHPFKRDTRFRCQATGKPTPKVTWYKDGQELRHNGRIKLKPNGDLLIVQSEETDSGYYQCMVNNSQGYLIALARLEIKKVAGSPDPVERVRVKVLSSSSVEVSWDPPSDPTNQIEFFIVHYKESSDELESFDSVPITDPRITSHKINNLKPNTNYTMYVLALNKIGSSLDSEYIVAKTDESAPKRAPRILNLSSPMPTAIKVTWEKLPTKDAQGEITEYLIFYEQGSTSKEVTVSGDQLEHVITNLKADTQYRIHVAAVTKEGPSPTVLEQQWSLQKTAPQQDSKDLVMDLDSVNNTAVMVKWKLLSNLYQVEGFRVYVYKTTGDTEQLGPYEVPATNFTYLITNLENGTWYNVNLKAYNSQGQSWTAVNSVYTMASLPVPEPPAPPGELEGEAVSSTSILIKWSPPQMEKEIDHYSIRYMAANISDIHSSISLAKAQVLISKSTSVVIKKLKPFTSYRISVSSHTSDVDGPSSNPFFVKTKEDVPSAPRDVDWERYSPTEIQITWKAPTERNGQILSYLIKYRPSRDEQNKDWMSLRQNGSITMADVKNLSPNLYYHIKVSACTAIGEGNFSDVVTVRRIGPPLEPSPTEVTATTENSKLGIIIGVSVGAICIIICIVIIVVRNSLDCVVPELFKAIREATQESVNKRPGSGELWEDLGEEDQCAAKAFFEVLYIGRVRVHGEKITSHYIDDLVDRFETKDPDFLSISTSASGDEGERRNRHASGASIKSLPATLDGNVTVTENELGQQREKLKYPNGCGDGGGGSGGSSTDDLLGISDNVDSSGENLLEVGEQVNLCHLPPHSAMAGSQSDSQDSLDGACTRSVSNPCNTDTSAVNGDGGSHHTPLLMYSKAERNRTMLFRLGLNDITLISPDLKSPMLERRFKDIPSVSQGSKKTDVFGFISREAHQVFVCHILRCHSRDVVDDVMTALRVAFTSAYEQNKLQICTMCPLHQLHKLCQELEGLSPQNAYELVNRRIQQLPEKDTADMMTHFKMENPQSFHDMVEVLMIQLRRLCESKQREHTHISDGNRVHWRQEFNIMDTKSSSKSKFDSFRNKAKKSLTSSFENLLSRGRRNSRDEAKEAFRQRSATLDSESSLIGRSMDSSTHTTPDESPIHSPINKDHKEQFKFPSPNNSPKADRRPRSSTLGAAPDHSTTQRKHSLQPEQSPSEFGKEDMVRRASSASHSSSTSPMRHMFLIAGSGGKHAAGMPRGDSPGDDPTHLSPGRRGSWRQAIFNRVVSPVHIPDTIVTELDCEGERDREGRKLSPQTLRCMWRKAILETLLLIRMEKENQDLRARQDEALTKRQKLDYTEIAPGNLAEVLSSWDRIVESPDRATRHLDAQTLLDTVKMGVPRTKRGDVWQYLVEQHRYNNPALGDLHTDHDPTIAYEDLLKQLTTHQHAILIDLGRTFPGHPYFSPQLGPGQLALFNLLKAYSLLDKEVGYCQGLSFVAGVLLMHMEEMMAFETMRYLMFELGLRKQYRPDMMALQIKLYQLTRLIHDNEKDLYDHFEANEIVPTLYAAPWFLTLFASQFPLGFVARVFDLIFLQGIDVIFKVGMVLLGNHKELIKQCDSFESIVEFLKTTLPEMGIIQMERIINQVFEMDITKQLQAYEVEYHVLQEEMLSTPQKGENDAIHTLEQANRNLKRQNMELLEKLQHANSQNHSLEIIVHNCQTNEAKLKSHICTLEIERAALLNAVTKLRHLLPEDVIAQANVMLPSLTDSWPSSPTHNSTATPSHSLATNQMPGWRSPGVSSHRSSTKSDRRSSPHSKSRTGCGHTSK